MEILFISHKYPPTIGGMEKQSYELITHAKKNHIVHQIVHSGKEESKFAFFRNLKSRVKKILKKYPNIDIIHLNDGLMGMFGLWLKSYTKIPVLLTFHGLDVVFPNKFYQKIVSKKISKFDGFICVSTATAQECLNRNYPPEKVFVVPNGVDHQIAESIPDRAKALDFFTKNHQADLSEKKIIAMLGRPVRRKGFSWFLENVVPHLSEEVMVVMIGPVSPPQKESIWNKMLPQNLKDQIQLMTKGLSDEEKIQELLQIPEINRKVIQTGKVPFPDLLNILQMAHLFAMPNVKIQGDAEGFGLVALEASICKSIVLASDMEGIPEAIQDGKNGLLLPSGKAEVWIKKINELLIGDIQLEKISEQFQQFTLENYSWEKMTQQYIEVFEKSLT